MKKLFIETDLDLHEVIRHVVVDCQTELFTQQNILDSVGSSDADNSEQLNSQES